MHANDGAEVYSQNEVKQNTQHGDSEQVCVMNFSSCKRLGGDGELATYLAEMAEEARAFLDLPQQDVVSKASR